MIQILKGKSIDMGSKKSLTNRIGVSFGLGTTKYITSQGIYKLHSEGRFIGFFSFAIFLFLSTEGGRQAQALDTKRGRGR